MDTGCRHLEQVRDVTPSADGCEDCLKAGGRWVHLRLCETCGHVGCCDNSPGRHATQHFRLTGHPVIKSFEPGEEWGWCYVDEVFFDSLPAAGAGEAQGGLTEPRKPPGRPGP